MHLTEAEVEDKRITLAEAAKKVSDGDGLFWGGFGYQRPPIAFSHELVRQKKRNLTVYTCGSEVDLEIMAGAGVVDKYEIAFSAIEALGTPILQWLCVFLVVHSMCLLCPFEV